MADDLPAIFCFALTVLAVLGLIALASGCDLIPEPTPTTTTSTTTTTTTWVPNHITVPRFVGSTTTVIPVYPAPSAAPP